MGKWKNPMVIRVERGVIEKQNKYILLERVNQEHHNYYRFVDKFNCLDEALKRKRKIMNRFIEKKQSKPIKQ